VQASSAVGRDFAVTIPFGTPVTLRVMSPHLKVTDQAGNPVLAIGTSVTAPSGISPSTVQYVITGTMSPQTAAGPPI
jgi:hypothetical protein